MFAFLGVAGFVSAVNVKKIAILGEPLVPADAQFLTTPEILTAMLTWKEVLGFFVLVVTLLYAAWWCDSHEWWSISVPPDRNSRRRVTAVSGLVVVFVLVSAVQFDAQRNPFRLGFELQVSRGTSWSTLDEFRLRGLLSTSFLSLSRTSMTKPPTYDKSQVAEVVARLTSDRQSRPTSKLPLQRWNVAVVLSESFADPLALGAFELERDPLRQFRTRADQGIGTSIFVDGYGTGTSNM